VNPGERSSTVAIAHLAPNPSPRKNSLPTPYSNSLPAAAAAAAAANRQGEVNIPKLHDQTSVALDLTTPALGTDVAASVLTVDVTAAALGMDGHAPVARVDVHTAVLGMDIHTATSGVDVQAAVVRVDVHAAAARVHVAAALGGRVAALAPTAAGRCRRPGPSPRPRPRRRLGAGVFRPGCRRGGARVVRRRRLHSGGRR